ncbi:MAG: sigma factor [Bacteroidota bacterium]|nr:sigma factor [Bacteroidota bacterium]
MPKASNHFSQEELLLSISKGNTAAFSVLYDTYSPVIFSVINKSCTDIKLSQELLQQAFVKIWHNIPNYDPSKQRFLAWILIIARSVLIEALQGHNLNKTLEIQTTANNVSSNIDALTLVYFKGYSLKKAAEILKVTETELKIKLKKEIDELRVSKIK